MKINFWNLLIVWGLAIVIGPLVFSGVLILGGSRLLAFGASGAVCFLLGVATAFRFPIFEEK